MIKQYQLLIILLIALIFIPLAGVNATQTYVGVQVASTEPATQASQPDTGKLWCLPIGTSMGLMYSGSYVTASSTIANPIVLTTPTCPGSTIWSGLLNLTNEASYTIRITPADGSHKDFCSGYFDTNNNRCQETWDVAGEDKNCNEVCGHYGQTANTDYGSGGDNCYSSFSSDTCAVIAKIKGSACSSCTATNNFSYYSKVDGSCFWTSGAYASCGWSDPADVRICVCNLNSDAAGNNFDFSFIPSGL